mmetsp:Transcript_32053/g.75179  ORF Transcript_32053/g.75179 Transcript_32053/m.75179 type:complete len:226 (-) Transcript_32053:284-961(-)
MVPADETLHSETPIQDHVGVLPARPLVIVLTDRAANGHLAVVAHVRQGGVRNATAHIVEVARHTLWRSGLQRRSHILTLIVDRHIEATFVLHEGAFGCTACNANDLRSRDLRELPGKTAHSAGATRDHKDVLRTWVQHLASAIPCREANDQRGHRQVRLQRQPCLARAIKHGGPRGADEVVRQATEAIHFGTHRVVGMLGLNHLPNSGVPHDIIDCHGFHVLWSV